MCCLYVQHGVTVVLHDVNISGTTAKGLLAQFCASSVHCHPLDNKCDGLEPFTPVVFG